MDDARSSRSRIRAHALQQAIDRMGSALALCAFLGIEPALLLRWISEAEEMPEGAFLRIVDIVCDDLDHIERKALDAARSAADRSGKGDDRRKAGC